MPPKSLCTCGCGQNVSRPTERKHLELAALDDLLVSALEANANSSKPCPLTEPTFEAPEPSTRKRKAATTSDASDSRARKRPTISQGASAETGNSANITDATPLEHSNFQDGDSGGFSNTFDANMDTIQTHASEGPASIAPTDTFPEDAANELSFLRRSARLEARLQFIAQKYHGPLANTHTPPCDEELIEEGEGEEGMSDEDAGEGEEDPQGNQDSGRKDADGAEIEEDWTLPAAPGEEGLSVWDLLDGDFLKEMSEMEGTKLDDGDIRLLQAYALKMEDGLSDSTFEKFRFLVPEANITSLKATESRVQSLSGFKPVRYDCCPNSCICYTGSHEAQEQCPYCQTPRYKSEVDKTPRAYFEYLPITPRLRSMVANPTFAEKMTYRSNHTPNPNNISDVFDGSHYRELLTTPVTIAEQTMPFCHFSDSRDIALGLSTDGFGPFKRRTKTAWPLVLFNYNLPPTERFAKHNLISAGVIPGPKKPLDLDSFLWPMVCEFIQLSIGVKAFDALQKSMFMLRVYLILVFGDIPAVSLLMRMKGQNGCSPCRMCNIQGIRVPNSKPNSPLYVPLHREKFPGSPPSYDPRNLPYRSHAELLEQAYKVQTAATKDKSEKLATKYGIKGVPLLSCLSSISFPASFPYDFMHLIWCNLIKNLIRLWTGTFKSLKHKNEAYYVDNDLWKLIGKETADAGSHIPSAFGSRVPDLAEEKSHLISETYANWTLQMSPAILRHRFLHERIYKHHLRLVKLLRQCLEFEFNTEKVQEIEEGFAAWVEDYETFYYKKDPSRASCCPLTLHALLHIASSIRQMGPVWAYWAFPMERHCGDIVRHVGSRRYPYASINRYVTSKAHLTQIKLLYNVHDELSLTSPPSCKDHFTCPGYKYFVLSPPVRRRHTLPHSLWLNLTASLATRFDVSAAAIRKLLPALTPVDEYGRVERVDGGDKMHAGELVTASDDGRDRTYIRYRLLVDIHAHVRRRKPEFAWREHYGQLLRIIVVDVPQSLPPNPKIKARTYVYAVIKNYDVVTESAGPMSLHYFEAGDQGRIEVVDLNRVKCVVGRIKQGDRWAIVDRHDLKYPVYTR